MVDAKIYIAGHTGLVGSALLERCMEKGCGNIVVKTHNELDLTRQQDVEEFFSKEQPVEVILLAARVGGIQANMTYPAQFIYENIAIQANVIHSAYLYGTKKLLFLGSACSYPRECPQPMKEEYILSGYLEATNEPYAVAKIAGITMCRSYRRQYGSNFICAIPTNAYGPNDNFDPENSHVIPALIMKFHDAKMRGDHNVTIWGTGSPTREFIYVDDLADACLFLMEHYDKEEIINIGADEDVSIKKLAFLVKEVTGFEGDIIFDTSRPDGAPRKILDSTRLKTLGWQAKTPLKEGLSKTYNWFLKNKEEIYRKWKKTANS